MVLTNAELQRRWRDVTAKTVSDDMNEATGGSSKKCYCGNPPARLRVF